MKHDEKLNSAVMIQFRKKRQEQNMTLEIAAAIIGSDKSLISRVEAGKASLDTLTQYADALGCHLELVPNNKETQAPSEPQKMTHAELVELNSLRRILSSIKELVK